MGLAFGAGRALPVIALAPFAGTERGGAVTAAMCERPAILLGLRRRRRGRAGRRRARPGDRAGVSAPARTAAKRTAFTLLAGGAYDPTRRRRAARLAAPDRRRAAAARRRAPCPCPAATPRSAGGRIAWIDGDAPCSPTRRSLGGRDRVATPGAGVIALSDAGARLARPRRRRHRPAVRAAARRRRAAAAARVARADRDRPPGAARRPRALPRRRPGAAASCSAIDAATGAQQLLRTEPGAQLTNPSTDGARLLYVRATGRQQELRVGAVAPGRPDRRPRCCSCTRPRAGATASTSTAATGIARATAAGARRCRRAPRRACRDAVEHGAHRRRRLRHPAARRSAARRAPPTSSAWPALALSAGRNPLVKDGRHFDAQAEPARAARGRRGARAAGRGRRADRTGTRPQPVAQGTGGAAATVDSVATSAARDVLRRGGNAVDAAVAAAAVLGVTEPFSCGIGGGGFMVIRTPHGKVTTIDSRERRPRAMSPTRSSRTATPLPFSDARYSGLSAGVPGTVAAWDEALRPLRLVELPPRARPGDRRRAAGLRGRRDIRLPDHAEHPVVRRHAVHGGALPRPRRHGEGRRRRPAQPGHGGAYERIARLGARKGFYRGPIAEAIAEAAQRPADVGRPPTRCGGPG